MTKYKVNNNGFEYIDLELPSGTLWATMNVGASKPSDYGLYFQWGDTVGCTADNVGNGNGKKKFVLDDYKWYANNDEETFSQDTSPGKKLYLQDDAANTNMGGDWHIPSPKQIEELIVNTNSDWTSLNGVNGMKFTSKKDASKSIFIPASGSAWEGSLVDIGDEGNVWSSTLDTDYAGGSQHLYFYANDAYIGYCCRFFGVPVRGVIDKKEYISNGKKNDMDNKLNLVEILKNAPKGTKLWSPVCGECEFEEVVDKPFPIKCKTIGKFGRIINVTFTSSGNTNICYENGECLLFPSKENRDWSTFKLPKAHKHFEPFQKVLVGLMMDGKKIWKRDVYMYYRKDIKEHCTVFESMVPDDLIMPYDANKDGKPVNSK